MRPMDIPSYMPVLSRGKHPSPEKGACVMEYISFLAGERWTDFPSCTNKLLAEAAQITNDDLEDSERHRLIPLIPRLMGASESSLEIEEALAEAARAYVEPLIGHSSRIPHEEALHAQHWAKETRSIISSAHVAIHFAGWDTVAFLSALIDAYDKATGRTQPAPVTEEDLRRCAELTGATR